MDSAYRQPQPEVGTWRSVAHAAIERVRLPGEEVLWYGRPLQGIRFFPADVRYVFPLVWICLVLFGALYAVGHHDPIVLVFVELPLLVLLLWLGVRLLAGLLYIDGARRARTFYALTSRRVLFVTADRVHSMDLASLRSCSLQNGYHGRGTLVFGDDTLEWMRWPGWRSGVPSFDGIDDAREVRDKLFEATQALLEPAATRPRVLPLEGQPWTVPTLQ